VGALRYLSLLLITLTTPLVAEERLDLLLEGFEQTDEQPAERTELLDEGLLSGFDEPTAPPAVDLIAVTEVSPLEWYGSVSLQGEYGYAHSASIAGAPDYRGLSHLRLGADLGFDYRYSPHWQLHGEILGNYDAGYRLNGRDDYDPQLLDEEESELEIGEMWIRGELGSNLDLKLGRQIVVWGKSDNLSVTNILNPIDNRSPGMVDVKDLRLPLMMARLDYYFTGLGGNWGMSAIAIPEISFNKNPASGSEFYILQPAADEEIPDNGLDNSEYAVALNGLFSGWDLSLYRAQLYDDNPYFTTEEGTPQLLHSRIQMNGLAANGVSGGWLFKGELGHLRNLRYSNTTQSYRRVDMLLGVEYAGIKETSVSVEWVQRNIVNHDSVLQLTGVDKQTHQLALSVRQDRMHDRLHLVGLVLLNDLSTDSGGKAMTFAGSQMVSEIRKPSIPVKAMMSPASA